MFFGVDGYSADGGGLCEHSILLFYMNSIPKKYIDIEVRSREWRNKVKLQSLRDRLVNFSDGLFSFEEIEFLFGDVEEGS